MCSIFMIKVFGVGLEVDSIQNAFSYVYVHVYDIYEDGLLCRMFSKRHQFICRITMDARNFHNKKVYNLRNKK